MIKIVPPSEEYRAALAQTRRNKARGMHPGDVEVSKRINEFRIAQGVTLQEMADELGVHVNQVSKYMRAENKIPMSRFVHLCTFLGASPTDMLYGLEEVKTRPTRETPKRLLTMMRLFDSIEDQISRDAIYRMIYRVAQGDIEL